jgi:transcriptional regulator of acetoin/glycerol metabolism
MSIILDDRARSVIRAKDILINGSAPRALPVHQEVAASWRRCIRYGLRPAECSPTRPSLSQTHAQLRRAAAVVMERKRPALAQSMTCVSLTATDGTMLDRWVEDREFLRRLDQMHAVSGISIAESVMGTSSSSIAFETEQPFSVAGPEHFSEAWFEYTSSSALIRHPLTKGIIATLNLSVSYAHTSPVLVSWVVDVATEIERAILDEASTRERLLLDSFLASQRDSRHPLVCLDDGTIISNAAAARVLTHSDQSSLWEHASRCLNDGTRTSEIVLTDGRTAELDMTAVFDGRKAFGTVIKIVPQGDGRAARPVPIPVPVDTSALAPLVGRSTAWQKLCREVTARDTPSRLLVGSAGVGKLAVSMASRKVPPVVIDVAAPQFRDQKAWDDALAEATRNDHPFLVLRHLHHLDSRALRLAGAFVAQATARGIQVDGTATTPHGSDVTGLLSDWFDAVVTVPDLADRTDDMQVLVEALTARRAEPSSGRTFTWLPDAVQTLARIEWPQNVRSLDTFVARTLADSRFPVISAADLPADIRARASRRSLVGLERIEANAIITALRDADGNKREAAASLGIARSTLYRKVRALGLDLGSWNF